MLDIPRSRALFAVLAVALLTLVSYGAYLWNTADTDARYEYATYADVKNDQSVHSATVPDFVPGSAREISGSYNVEFNTQALEFSFDPADQTSLVSSFRRVAGSEGESVEQSMRRVHWNTHFPASVEIFMRTGSGYVERLAIDSRNGHAYYATE